MMNVSRRILRSPLIRAVAAASSASRTSILQEETPLSCIRAVPLRHFDIYHFGSKEAIAKERERITDEMSRGYFADISDMEKHGGKIAKANETLIPALEATKFPTLEVNFTDGRHFKLPIGFEEKGTSTSTGTSPSLSLLCLSFRSNSQVMVESWSIPFLDAFDATGKVQIYEVSLIDSWFLSRSPIKQLLLRIMRKSKDPKRHAVYSFGDHYYFRKELKILNLLTGYIFLLDGFGRIRWQAFGLATPEELSSLLSCTSQLLEEK
ncbi:hypothetical protein QJS10_CPB15g02042 [Acorus calamus]|uniref:AT1G08220-like protein n=1 Tax=Acorus calamus TaxID=4465 RepID=A0AAV9D922_ACOCL|nr:hypothetical protein QJS10_CPB15g02042 [Acorus calamus]